MCKSFRLERQICPFCKSGNVFLLKSLVNLLVVVVDVIIGLLLLPPFAYRLKCGECGKEYPANIDKT